MADDAFQPYSFFELSELDPAFRADPHSRLDAMRARCPVHHDPGFGQVRITAHAPAREILYDTSLSRDLSRARPDNPVRMFMEADNSAIAARLTEELGIDVAARSNASILFSEDPDHARIRGILLKRFQERVARFRPQVEAVVDAALDDLAGQSRFDLIAGYAEIIPVNVIAALLGVTVSDTMQFRHWSSDLLAVFNPMASAAQRAARMDAVVGLMKLMHGLIRQAAESSGDDFISDILRDRAAGAAISDAELADNLLTLLVAGHLTTTDLIGNGVWLLLTHPEERARLAAEPALIAGAVEEILRYEPPTPISSRFAVEPRPLGDCIAQPREAFLVSMQAANRDPAVFDAPHRFDITRRANRHMTFGGGAHMCLGASLARLEGQVAIARLFARMPGLRLADPDAAPQWRTTPGFRGLERLDVCVG